MMLLYPTRMYCRTFIWPFIQSPGIYYPIALLVKALQRGDHQTVALFVKSGCSWRRRKNISAWFFCAFVGAKYLNETLFIIIIIIFAMFFIKLKQYTALHMTPTHAQQHASKQILATAAITKGRAICLWRLYYYGAGRIGSQWPRGQAATLIRWIEVERNAKIDKQKNKAWHQR